MVPTLRPGEPFLIGLTIALAVAIIYLHRANIGRLLKGTERKFGEKMKE